MICASHRLKVHYLGPDLPAAEIARYSREVDAAWSPSAWSCSKAIPPSPRNSQAIREALGPDVPVWIGGQGALGIDEATLPSGCLVIGDRAELEQRLDILPR